MGNTVPTLPYDLHGLARTALGLKAAADSEPDSGTGSRLFQVSKWLWRFGRGQARTRQLLRLRQQGQRCWPSEL